MEATEKPDEEQKIQTVLNQNTQPVVAEKDQDIVPPQAPKKQPSEKSNGQEDEKQEDQKSSDSNAPDLDISMADLVKKFNLTQSYDTLEGHTKLNKE